MSNKEGNIKQGFPAIQDILNEMTEAEEAAGGCCLIYQGGRECCYYEAGYADIETKAPLRRDTIFRLYSMSKPMTAAAAVLLMQEGKLDITSPVSSFIPSFSNPMVASGRTLEPAKREVKVQDLLNMTSGYSYEGEENVTQLLTKELVEEIQERMYGENPLSTLEIAERLGKIPLAFHPGERFLYGMSADILGAVIEVVSGKRLGEFLKERIWEPLGMNDTGFYVPPEKKHRLAQTYCMDKGKLTLYTGSRLGIFNRMEKPPAFESGGAGLASTIDDYLKFCRMLLNGGTLEGHVILKKPAVEFLTRTTITKKQRRGMECWEALNGYSYGNLMRILTKPQYASTFGSKGEYGWDGWLGPYMSVAPDKELIILVMEQLTGAGDSVYTRRIRNVVYSEV